MVKKRTGKKSVFKIKKKSVVKKVQRPVVKKASPAKKKESVKTPTWMETFPTPDLRLREDVLKKLEDGLKEVPQDQIEKVKKGLGGVLEGETSWLRLFTLPPEQLYALAQIGHAQFENARYDRARKIFQGLAILDPENYYYHSMLGAIFQQQEKWPESILEYSIALDINPADRTSYTNRGEVYFKLGFYKEALRDFKLAIGGDDGKDRWANRAKVLMKQMEALRKS